MHSLLSKYKLEKYINLNMFYKIRSKLLDQIFISSRSAHTDIKIPNFEYRKNSSEYDYQAREGSKAGHGILLGTHFVAALYSAKAVAHFFIKSMSITADVQALAKVEINLTEIPEGGHTTIKWRGKPLFLKHRLPNEIKDCRETLLSSLRDPESDEQRCQKQEWLVVIGVCTHLGCVPIPNSGDYLGGYYCPCHGSHYDAAGRIRKGPAPTNLEIPEHEFQPDNKLVVG